MTIQIPNVGTGVPADQTGDSPWLAMKKVADNFSNTSHAASRLVDTAPGSLMEVGAFGLGAGGGSRLTPENNATAPTGFYSMSGYAGAPSEYSSAIRLTENGTKWIHNIFFPASKTSPIYLQSAINDGVFSAFHAFIILGRNCYMDSNGFYKGASPVIDLYSDRIELNDNAKEYPITFEKISTGNYLVKGSLGFAQEGWYIETPKDANGNVLVAVVYEQLANNDISIKTYAKKFDDETGDIVANLLKPRDIPVGRFISLRLHELPKESPVMPTEPPTEV